MNESWKDLWCCKVSYDYSNDEVLGLNGCFKIDDIGDLGALKSLRAVNSKRTLEAFMKMIRKKLS